ncbi:hypothetical protein ACEQ8H_001792 [Pleosporales sp. CAS-2024a]
MTAPPETRMPPATWDPFLGLASSYISPASTAAFDSTSAWPPMPPLQEPHVQPPRETSTTPATTANDDELDDGGFTFITARTPTDFRSKEVRATVRKKAMDSFLKDQGKTSKKSNSSPKSRISSVESDSRGSTKSKLSVGSQDALTEPSNMPTNVSQASGSADGIQASSPAKSSVMSSFHEHGTSAAEGPLTKFHPPRHLGSSANDLFYYCEDPRPYDRHTPAPFVSIGRALDPFRTMFQSSHPQVSVEDLKFQCNRYFGTRALGKYWIPTALNYSHTFLGTLCLAAAYRDVINQLHLESVHTIALRQEVIHLIGKNMLDPEKSVSDDNIMAVIQLIISEVIGREESGLSYHEQGIETMVIQRGGLDKLGIDGRLASTIAWVSLASAVLREQVPRTMYTEYCVANSNRRYQSSASLPESPIFCPQTPWKTIPKSSKCTPKAQELLVDIRVMIDSMLHERKSSRRNSQTLINLFDKITDPNEFPPVCEIRKTRHPSVHDYRYEAIRIASIIQATAIMRRIPLSDAITEAANLPVMTAYYDASEKVTSYHVLVSPQDRSPEPIFADKSTLPMHFPGPMATTVPPSLFPPAEHRPSMSSLDTCRPFTSTSTAASAARASMSSSNPSGSFDHEYTYFEAPRVSVPSNTTRLLKHLRAAIECSNISACWGNMAGVLLWLGLVVGAASNKSDSKLHGKYFSALTMRAGVMLCFEHPEAINNTMVRMSDVIQALAPTRSGGRGSHDGGAGKKRRT